MTTMFLSLLNFLALASGADAKAEGSELDLGFPLPDTSPATLQTVTESPKSRACCSLGGSSSPSLDPTTIWEQPHEYLAGAGTNLGAIVDVGGKVGYVYTRHGGFIDLGHARDYIDRTRFFAGRYRDAARFPVHANGMAIFNEGGDITLRAEHADAPDTVLTALIGAKLAFEHSVWHEIVSYFPQSGALDEKYSAFAPEDIFSNAVGCVAGYRALLNADVDFNKAADIALREVLEQLGPAPKDVTELATSYIKDRWWKPAISSLNPFSDVLRRHFLTAGPVTPWLVTDIAIPGKASEAAALRKSLGTPLPAKITIPTHVNGIFLEQRATLNFRNFLAEIVPLAPDPQVLRSIDLLTVSERIRLKAKAEEAAGIDIP